MDPDFKMSRRELILRGIAAGAALCFGGGPLYQKCSASMEQRTSFSHVELPQHFIDRGFKVELGRDSQSDRQSDRQNERQVLFVSEHAAENVLSPNAAWRFKESSIIDYLVDKHHADSLGLYAIYGPSSPDMDDKVQEEFEQQFSGINKYFALRRGYSSSRLAKYLSQDIIPCYGIEDKDAYFRSRAVEGFDRALFYMYLLNRCSSLDNNGLDLFKKSAEAVSALRKKFPDINFPQCPIEELARINPPKEVYDYHEHKFDVMITARNKEMASNIHANMERLGSRRGIVLAKIMHLHAERRITPLQDCVEYASSMIDVPSRALDFYDPFFTPKSYHSLAH